MKTRITRISVLPNNCSIFEDQATHIEIDDEGGGEFVSIEQPHMHSNCSFQVNPSEWTAIRAAINKLVKECKDD